MTKQLRGLTEELQKVVCSYSIAPFRSATVALALLSLRADKLPAKEKWASIVDQMQSKAMVWSTRVLHSTWQSSAIFFLDQES